MSDESRPEAPDGLEFESKRFDRRKFVLGATGLAGAAARASAAPAFADISRASAHLSEQTAGIWPTLPAFPAANFLDHFPGSSLDSSRWASVVSGSGAVTVTDSYVDMVAQANSAAFIYYKSKLDKTKSQLWLAGVSSPGAPNGNVKMLSVLNGSGAPSADTLANINARLVIDRSFVARDLNCILDNHFDNTNTRKFWDGSRQAWSAYGGTIKSMVAQRDDFHVVGLEIDGPNSRWRLIGWGQAFNSAGSWQFDQGWRLFALTDWVMWAKTRDSSNLWLIVGQPATGDAMARELRLEWVRYCEAPAGNRVIDAWAAAHRNNSDFARVRHYYSYDGLTYVPQDRTSWALDSGGPQSPDEVEAAQPRAVYDGVSTDYIFYSGKPASGPGSICLASAAHASPQNGPWTKHGTILSVGASGANDEKAASFPFVFRDNSEPDTNKRWKMLYSGKKASDSKWRTLYATAPAPTGPWTKRGTVLDVGGAAADDEKAARDPVAVRYGAHWEVWYEGWDAGGKGHLMRATGSDFASLTKDRTIYSPSPAATDQALTANLTAAPGRTVNVGRTTGYQVDATVVLSQSNNRDTWSYSRIRKVVSATVLELYHGLTGFTTTYPARIKQMDSCPNLTPRAIVRVGSEWWFYVTIWEPFSHTAEQANYAATLEENFLLKHSAAAPSGATPAVQYLSSPSPARGFNNDQGSVENFTLLLNPFTG